MQVGIANAASQMFQSNAGHAKFLRFYDRLFNQSDPRPDLSAWPPLLKHNVGLD